MNKINFSGLLFAIFTFSIIPSKLFSYEVNANDSSQKTLYETNPNETTHISSNDKNFVELKAKQDEFIGGNLVFLEDPSGSLTIDEVRQDQWQNQFKKHPKALATFDYTKSAYWAKLSVSAKSASITGKWILQLKNHFVEQVDVFLVDQFNQQIKHYHGGRAYPYYHRVIDDTYLSFPLYITQLETYHVYLRLKTATGMQFNFWVLDENSHHHDLHQRQSIEAFFLGVLLSIFIYNFL